MTKYRTTERHSPPSRTRIIAGWIAIVAGIAMVVLPGPGLIAIALGRILLGRNNPTLRRWSVLLRLLVNRMCHSKRRWVCAIGKLLRSWLRQARALIREELHRHAAGKPFSAGVQVMIGFALLVTLVSIGAGAAMLISG